MGGLVDSSRRRLTYTFVMRRRGSCFGSASACSAWPSACADGLDRLAALVMRTAEPASPATTATPEHWTAAENNTWMWFEREHLLDGHWKLTGITTPTNKRTGERHPERTGYLDDSLVPEAVRRGEPQKLTDAAAAAAVEDDPGQPNPWRRARYGRPPSRWLRSLYADELRIWLKTIDVPKPV